VRLWVVDALKQMMRTGTQVYIFRYCTPHRIFCAVVLVKVYFIVLTQTQFNLDKYTRIFITVDAVVWSIYHFVYLILLLLLLFLALFVFCLCHFCMLATAVTIHLPTPLVFGTIFLFSILLHSPLPLLSPHLKLIVITMVTIGFIIQMFFFVLPSQGGRHPNVLLRFTIAGG
jgi:hypothetical protein